MGLITPPLITRRSELVIGNAYDIYIERLNPSEKTKLPDAPYIYVGYQENDNRYEFRSYTQNQLRSFDYSSVEGLILPDGRLRNPTPLPTDVVFGTRYLTIYNYKLPNQAPSGGAGAGAGGGAGGAAYRTGVSFGPSLTIVRLPGGGEWFMGGGRRKSSKTKRKTKMRYSPRRKTIRK